MQYSQSSLNKATILLLVAVLMCVSYVHCQFPQLYTSRLEQHLNDRKDINLNTTKFDFIIVGAGSAGSLLANRLSEKFSVLVLEAGQSDNNTLIKVPVLFSQLFGTEYDWTYFSEPESNVNNRPIFLPRGKVLGGTSSINAMINNRGFVEDYNRWAKLVGDKSWSWDRVLPIFKKTQNYMDGNAFDPESHGDEGDYVNSDPNFTHEITKKWRDTLKQQGVRSDPNHQDGDSDGYSFNIVNIKNGERFSMADAMFNQTVLQREKLYVRTNAQAIRLLRKGSTITGVRWVDRTTGYIHETYVKKEVILSSGAMNSPHLLMLSGIGDKEDLKEFFTDKKFFSNDFKQKIIDLPGVGQNLQDHPQAGIYYNISKVLGSLDTSLTPQQFVNWLTTKQGPFNSNVGELLTYMRTKFRCERENPDIQFVFASVTFDPDNAVPIDANTAGITIGSLLLKPKSTGSIKMQSQDYNVLPKVFLNYFDDERDLDILVDGLRKTRQYAKTMDVFNDEIQNEMAPGKDVTSTEDLKEYIRNTVLSGYHQTSTCKMGRRSDRMAVVDHKLRVYKTRNLRVIDASIMPEITSSNVNMPTVMIAEKGAEMIMEEYERRGRPRRFRHIHRLFNL